MNCNAVWILFACSECGNDASFSCNQQNGEQKNFPCPFSSQMLWFQLNSWWGGAPCALQWTWGSDLVLEGVLCWYPILSDIEIYNISPWKKNIFFTNTVLYFSGSQTGGPRLPGPGTVAFQINYCVMSLKKGITTYMEECDKKTWAH